MEYARTSPVLLLDYDAPLAPTRLTKQVLERIVNEDSPYGKPFGHGYVIAATVLEELTGEPVRIALKPAEAYTKKASSPGGARAKTGKRKVQDGPMDAYVNKAAPKKRSTPAPPERAEGK